MSDEQPGLGRLYCAFHCKRCKKDFPVHILRATFEDPASMLRARPPCPNCDAPGILHKDSRVFASLDGGKQLRPVEVAPYIPPDPNAPPEPKRNA